MESANALAIRKYPAAVGCTCPLQQSPVRSPFGSPALGPPKHNPAPSAALGEPPLPIGVYQIFIPFFSYAATVAGRSWLNITLQFNSPGKPIIEARKTFGPAPSFA